MIIEHRITIGPNGEPLKTPSDIDQTIAEQLKYETHDMEESVVEGVRDENNFWNWGLAKQKLDAFVDKLVNYDDETSQVLKCLLHLLFL